MKSALIIGINGQDGTYLSKFLINKNYKVYGIVNPNSKKTFNIIMSKFVQKKQVKVYNQNILDFLTMKTLLKQLKPDEIYYLASTHELSLEQINYNSVFSVNVWGFTNLLEIIKIDLPFTRIFYASSSNIFSHSKHSPQNEMTEKKPSSLYGVAKVTAMHLCNLYKKKYNLFITSGILYNHESFLRNKEFLPKKIVNAAIDIKNNKQKYLYLGNLDDQRDWGSAEEYVEAMWLINNAHEPDEFIVGSGKLHNVQELVEMAFNYLDLNWEKFVIIDDSLKREKEQTILLANINKIKKKLNWSPQKKLNDVLIQMIDDHFEYSKI